MADISPEYHSVPAVDEAQVNRESRRKLLLVIAGFAVAAFLVTELMHYLLVPDLGPYRERIMAEGGSALILGMLAAKLLHNAYNARQQALARLQVIAALNHHVRNALEVISLSAYITHDEEAIRRITEGVNRIDWALREILPQEFPLVAGECSSTSGPWPGGGKEQAPPGPLQGDSPPSNQAITQCTAHNTAARGSI